MGRSGSETGELIDETDFACPAAVRKICCAQGDALMTVILGCRRRISAASVIMNGNDTHAAGPIGDHSLIDRTDNNRCLSGTRSDMSRSLGSRVLRSHSRGNNRPSCDSRTGMCRFSAEPAAEFANAADRGSVAALKLAPPELQQEEAESG
jgi:hypothetical protein